MSGPNANFGLPPERDETRPAEPVLASNAAFTLELEALRETITSASAAFAELDAAVTENRDVRLAASGLVAALKRDPKAQASHLLKTIEGLAR